MGWRLTGLEVAEVVEDQQEDSSPRQDLSWLWEEVAWLSVEGCSHSKPCSNLPSGVLEGPAVEGLTGTMLTASLT